MGESQWASQLTVRESQFMRATGNIVRTPLILVNPLSGS